MNLPDPQSSATKGPVSKKPAATDLPLKSRPGRGPADITANFTDNQWYCHLARQTVFFSAFSNGPYGMKQALATVRHIIRLAPHILKACGFENPDSIDDELLSSIMSFEKVADLDAFPDRWTMVDHSMFDDTSLPPLRMKVAMLENGPDERGRFAAILILSTHSMFEGMDASNLARSRPIERGAVTRMPDPVSRFQKLGFLALSAALAPLQLMAAFLFAPRVADIKFRSLVMDRSRLRALAGRLGITQQALIFALAAFALGTGNRVFPKKSARILYADLSKTGDFRTNDEFFQFRMIELRLRMEKDFPAFAMNVSNALKQAESGSKHRTQTLLNAMFGMHRRLHRVFPFFYGPRLFRFSAGYDFSLSLAPPQRLGGDLTGGLVEPVFTGPHHPGFSTCVFSPGRTHVTFCFSLRQKYLKNIDTIPELLHRIDPLHEKPTHF